LQLIKSELRKEVGLLNQIKSITAKENYILEVILENGSSINLNMKSRLKTLRFGMLTDEEFFKRATTDGTCINWDNKIEISLSEVFQMAQK
jgi:predicted site-specific integrase-resolvase